MKPLASVSTLNGYRFTQLVMWSQSLTYKARCQQAHSVCILDTITRAQKINKNPTKTASTSLPNVLKVKMKPKDLSGKLSDLLMFLP